MRRLAHWVVALAVCGAACSNTDTAATTVTPVSYDVIGQVADVDLSRWIAEFDSDGRLLGGPGTITLDDGTRIDVARGTPARNDCTEFGGPARSRTACVVVAMLRADTTQAEWFVGQPASVGDDGELSLSVEAIAAKSSPVAPPEEPTAPRRPLVVRAVLSLPMMDTQAAADDAGDGLRQEKDAREWRNAQAS